MEPVQTQESQTLSIPDPANVSNVAQSGSVSQTSLNLLKKVSSALQTAVRISEVAESEKYYVVVERDWDSTKVVAVSSDSELAEVMSDLRAEIVTQQLQNMNVQASAYIFRGRRLFLQTFPTWAVVDGDKRIAVDGGDVLPPFISEDGAINIYSPSPSAVGANLVSAKPAPAKRISPPPSIVPQVIHDDDDDSPPDDEDPEVLT